MADASIKIDLTLSDKQALDALKTLSANFEVAGKSAEKFGQKGTESVGAFEKGISKLSSKFDIFVGNLAANLATKALSSLARGFSTVLQEARDFDRAIREIETILPAGAKATKLLTDQLTRLSQEFATDKATQAKAFYQVVSAGTTDTVQAIKLLDAANTLALGGIAEVGSAVNILTDIINVYGSENVNAADAADSLFTAVRLGKTEIPQLADSLGKTLPLAKQLGLSYDEVSAAISTLTSKGLTTKERVTQLNAALIGVIRGSEKASAVLGKDLADSFSVAALKTKGLSVFLADLTKNTGGSEEKLLKLLGSTEAMQAVISLTEDGLVGFNSQLAEFENKAGASQVAADKMRESFDFQFDQLLTNVKSLALAFIEDMAPALTSATTELNKFIGVFLGVGQDLDTVDSQIGKVSGRIDEINTAIQKANSKENQGWISSIFGGPDVTQLNGELEKLNSELAELTEKKRFLTEGDTASGTGGGDPSGDAEVQAKASNIERIKALEEQKRISDEELRLTMEAEELERSDAKFAKLVEDLGREAAIKYQAEQTVIKDKEKLQELAIKKEIDTNRKSIKEKQALEEAKKKEDEKALQNYSSILGSMAQLSAIGGRKNFKYTQALNLASALTSGFNAVQGALAAPPGFPFNAASVAAVTAMSVANVARIANTKAPSFAQGGFVPGTSFTGDRVTANVNSGEAVLNKRQQVNFMNMANGMGGGEGVLRALGEIHSAIMNRNDTRIEINGREIINVIRDEQSSGRAIA